jgi:hypothetical protein
MVLRTSAVSRATAALAVLLLAAAGMVLTRATGPAFAGALGSLPSTNPTLVFDDRPGSTNDRWISLSDSESLLDAQSRPRPLATPCDPNDTAAWAKGWANVPYRVGPTPAQLRGCWEGDAMPGGPPGWARNAAGSVTSPTIGRINTWVLFYTAVRADDGRRCIGAAVSQSPVGPGWIHSTPLVCPSGVSAYDPQLYYDRQTNGWYLLWAEDVAPCGSRIRIQALDGNGALTGTPRTLLTATTPGLGRHQRAPPHRRAHDGAH